MGNYRHDREELGSNRSITATTTTTKKDISLNRKAPAGLMSPRSVVKGLTLGDANPYHDPLDAMMDGSGTSILPPFRGKLAKIDHHFSSAKVLTNSKDKAACQRRTIFPTYKKDPQPTYKWSVMRPSSTDTTTTTKPPASPTRPSSMAAGTPVPAQKPVIDIGPLIPPSPAKDKKDKETEDVEIEKPCKARRASVLPIVPSLNATTKGETPKPFTLNPSKSGSSCSGLISDEDRVRLAALQLATAPKVPAAARPEASKDLSPTQQQLAAGRSPTPGHSNRHIITITPEAAESPLLAPTTKQPKHRETPTHPNPVLRQNPKYSSQSSQECDVPPASASTLVKDTPHESSLPSLVDLKGETNDDDSQSSTSHDDVVTGTKKDEDDIVEVKPTPPTTPEHSTEVITVDQDSCLVTPQTSERPQSIGFDPRVWVREFHRDPDEADVTWYTDDDMNAFRRMALERILRYQSTMEILPTGTGRTVQRRTTMTQKPWKGPIYSHAALTLDGENRNDVLMKRKVMERELHSILIVDPQDLCLNLFSRAFQKALPSEATTISTASSTAEVLKHLEDGKHFDLIIVEERLQLFRHHDTVEAPPPPPPEESESLSSSFREQTWWWSPKRDARNKKKTTVTLPDASGAISSSGAALIQSLSHSPLACNALFVGVSAHMEEDEFKLKLSGADLCWPKPPPSIDEKTVEQLVKALLIKRKQTVLANELFS